MRGSSFADGPARLNRSGVCNLGDGLGPATLLAGNEASEPFKEIRSPAGTRHEDIATIAFVTFAAQIAEATQCVQGARDNRFGDTEQGRQTTNRVRAVGSVDEQEQRHLSVSEIRLAR